MQVLIVDDDNFAPSVLESTLVRMGYSVVIAHDGVEAMAVLRRGEIRLMVTGWEVPGMDGVELCHSVRREDLPGYVYVIMLTGREGDPSSAWRACTPARTTSSASRSIRRNCSCA